MPCNCVKCGRPFEQGASRGRPQSYCSTGCRRAAEYEVRRLDKSVDDLERRLATLRLGEFSLDDAEVLAKELRRTESRLAELLTTGDYRNDEE